MVSAAVSWQSVVPHGVRHRTQRAAAPGAVHVAGLHGVYIRWRVEQLKLDRQGAHLWGSEIAVLVRFGLKFHGMSLNFTEISEQLNRQGKFR